MVYLDSSEEWQRQSSLLLQARPTTTRITTKYNLPNLDSPKYQQVKKRKRDAEAEHAGTNDAPRVPKARLVLKTYDPESGVVLKFRTDRAADVGRLVAGLGRLGRHMAALPEKTEEPTVDHATAKDIGAAQPVPSESKIGASPGVNAQTPPQASGGGGKKKKKGKK